MRDLVAQRLDDTPDCVFVEPHAPYRPCGIPVRRLHIDPRERSRCRALMPTARLEGTNIQARRRTRAREDHLHRARQAARHACRWEVVFATHAGPLSRLTLVGFAAWDRHDAGRSVTSPARQYAVYGVRRNFLLLRSSNRALEAQEPLRQSILDAYSRLEERA